MGSIGYLSGTYMGGPSDLGFSFDGNPAHYPPWKLSGQYFPRGEAPPPYEEAIALAQAESLNSCTVSVATTHRTLPLNVCTTEPEMSSNITANLINININNAGNITAVATGENHILSSSFGRSPANTLSRQSELVSVNPASDTPIYPCNVPQVIALPTREVPCTLQNCELNTNITTNSFCNLSTGRSPNCSLRQLPKEVQTSNQSIATVSNNVPNNQVILDRITSMSANAVDQRPQTTAAILPPPLFSSDPSTRETVLAVPTNSTGGGNVGGISGEIPKTPSTKRFHRTIPRHLSGVDSIMPGSSGVGNNNSNTVVASQQEGLSPGGKKASCQCPVPHVPCSYMGSQLNSAQQPPNNVFLSTLTTKLNNVAAKQTIKSMSPKIQTISKQENTPPTIFTTPNTYEATQHSLRRMKPSLLKLEAAHPNTVMQTPNKKVHAIVSKQQSHGNEHKIETVLLHHQEPKPILKSKGVGSFVDAKDDPLMSAYPMTMIETVSKKVEPNPVLPPKLYKTGHIKQQQQQQLHHQHQQHQQQLQQSGVAVVNQNQMSSLRHDSYYSNSKIHTITMRPSETAQFSILNDRNSAQMSSLRFRHKPNFTTSLPRTESAHSCVDKLTTFSSKPPITTNQSAVVQYGNNTLPKNGKNGSSSRISDVVNKVPSVITLPHPQSTASTLRSITSYGSSDAILGGNSSGNITSSYSPVTTPKTPTTPTNPHQLLIQQQQQQQQQQHYGGDANGANGGGIFYSTTAVKSDKPLPVLTTSTNCTNPKQHFLPNDTSIDDEYLSECENCKTAHGSRYYLDEEEVEETRETMTLQRKIMPETESEEQQNYYRVSSTLPTNTSKKPPIIKRQEPWFTTIPASSSSDDDETVE